LGLGLGEQFFTALTPTLVDRRTQFLRHRGRHRTQLGEFHEVEGRREYQRPAEHVGLRFGIDAGSPENDLHREDLVATQRLIFAKSCFFRK
jgi:hypothetical protein